MRDLPENDTEPSSRVRKAVRCIGISFVAILLILTVVEKFNASREPDTKRLWIKNDVIQIVTAVKQYGQEYGRFPDLGAAQGENSDLIFGEPGAGAVMSNRALFDVLRAIPRGPNANHALNPNRIIFFESRNIANIEHSHSGFVDHPAANDAKLAGLTGCFLDPWGRQYNVILDTNFDGRLDLDTCYRDFAGEARPRQSVGAFSLGKDGLPGTRGNHLYREKDDSSDDVISWQ